MKRIVIICAVTALAISCSKSQQGAPLMREWAFETEYTKASIDDSGVFSWQQGDRIDIWDATSASFVPFTTIAGKGRFVATAPDNASFSLAAFYPSGIAGGTSYISLPSSYASAAEATAVFPMYAPVNEGDNTLHFKHLGAALTITCTSVQPELDRLELRSAGTTLSGRFDLSTVSGNQLIQQKTGNGTAEVRFSLSEEGTVSVTIPIPVGTYPVSICLGNDTDHEMLVVSSSSDMTFERAHRYKLKAFDYMTERYAFAGGTMESLTVEDDSVNW
ncbi:MAG: fimbrillin family protein [Bacteroidales bacterium]|nr:fimbrillin family protein [Bacteroidales bacterium]